MALQEDRRRRVLGFISMVLGAALSLGIILLLAAVQSVDEYAEFAKGMIFGGVTSALLGFGNDTILVRLSVDKSVDVRVVVLVRVLVFFAGTSFAALDGLRFMTGFVLISSAIMTHRFYFEMTDRQPVFNMLSVSEKGALISVLATIAYLIGPQENVLLLAIVLVWKTVAVIGFAWFVFRGELSPRRWVLTPSVTTILRMGLPFFMSYLFIQTAAVIASERVATDRVADFGTASQIGAALITAVTFWQRPIIGRYFGTGINIRSEMVGALLVTLLASSVVLLFMSYAGEAFHLAARGSVMWGFCIYAMAFALLHPLELAGYAAGAVTPSRVMKSSIVVGLLCVPSALLLGLWSVPLLMLVNTMVIVWSLRQHQKIGSAVP